MLGLIVKPLISASQATGVAIRPLRPGGFGPAQYKNVEIAANVRVIAASIPTTAILLLICPLERVPVWHGKGGALDRSIGLFPHHCGKTPNRSEQTTKAATSEEKLLQVSNWRRQ